MRSRDYNDFSFFVYLESETEIKYKGGSRGAARAAKSLRWRV